MAYRVKGKRDVPVGNASDIPDKVVDAVEWNQINKTNQKESLYSYLLKSPSFNASAPGPGSKCDHSDLPEN